MSSEIEIQNDTDESLLAELDSIDGDRAERSSGTTAAQRKARRNYMRGYRSKKAIENSEQAQLEKRWADNLAKLSESDRQRLLNGQEEVRFLNHLMSLVDRGVSFCGRGIGEVHKDFPDPNEVYAEIQSWLEAGNTFAGRSDDECFRDYGLKVHISPSIYERLIKNLKTFNRRIAGESAVPNTTFVQATLTQTTKQERELIDKQIRKEVGL